MSTVSDDEDLKYEIVGGGSARPTDSLSRQGGGTTSHLDDENLSILIEWMIKEADILPSNALAYAQSFIQNGIGSFNRIAKRIQRDPHFFLSLGVSLDDAEEVNPL